MKLTSLEALRGIAALGVVLFHSGFVVQARGPVLENASLFVDFFFILSGFVMAHAYLERIGAGMPLRSFAILRLGRLYPMHLLMLVLWLVYVVWDGLAPGADWTVTEQHLRGLLPNLLMLNSVGLQPHLTLNYPSWSVGAEFLAYLLFFAVVAGLRGRLTAGRALALAIAAYGVLAMQGNGTLQATHDFGFLRCVGGFFAGVALQRHMAGMAPLRLGTGAELAVVVQVVVLLALPPGSVAVELVTLMAFAALILVFAQSRGAVSRILCSRVPAWLGQISYSIYMIHALVIVIVFGAVDRAGLMPRAVIASPVHGDELFLLTPYAWAINAALVAVIVMLSALSHRHVEQPFRAASRRLAQGQGAPLRAG